MKRMFAKCFLQKHSEGKKGNKSQDSVILISTPEETNKINELNVTTKAINHVEINHNEDGVDMSQEENKITAVDGKKEIKTCEKESAAIHANHQRKMKLDAQMPSLHSFKPDLVPQGSPARKRVRSSRSNSKTLSFICLDSRDQSDDESGEVIVQDGKSNIQSYFVLSFSYSFLFFTSYSNSISLIMNEN